MAFSAMASQWRLPHRCPDVGIIAGKVRLHARPVEGQANTALVAWLASTLGIAKTQVQWVRGQNARRKRLCIGAAAAANAQWAALLL